MHAPGLDQQKRYCRLSLKAMDSPSASDVSVISQFAMGTPYWGVQLLKRGLKLSPMRRVGGKRDEPGNWRGSCTGHRSVQRYVSGGKQALTVIRNFYSRAKQSGTNYNHWHSHVMSAKAVDRISYLMHLGYP